MSLKRNPESRREKILEELYKKGKVSVAALSQTLGTTPVTIRSDLTALEQEGFLVRIQGGAVLPPRSKTPRDPVNATANVEEKQSIAAVMAKLVHDGDTLFINSGTTTEFVATALEIRSDLNIVTNSLAVATILGEIPSFRVILVGGEINARYGFTYGSDALSQLEKYKADWAILSIDGISASSGVTTHHAEEAMLDRMMISNAKNICIVADHTKIGNVGFARVLDDMKDITIITNSDQTGELSESGASVICV